VIKEDQMRFKDVLIVPFALSCAIAFAGQDSASHSRTAEEIRLDDLGKILQQDVDTNHRDGVVGVVAQVNDDKRIVRARAGESRLDSGKPVEFNTKFRIGSNTKTFVAVVVLQLVAEGKVRLEDTVERWLPGVVSGNGNDGSKITIRQLLQHTSGLHNYTADLFTDFSAEDYYRTRFDHHTPADLLAIALKSARNFEPGTSWGYSNTNYIVASMIIQKVTGRDWVTEVRARIIEPLGLGETTEPGDSPGLPLPHSQGYNLFPEGGPLVDVTQYNHTWGGPAGSLISTTSDLTRFWRALLSGQLLAPAQMEEMQKTVPATGLDEVLPGARYGLGIMTVPTNCGGIYWAHFGDTYGFSTRNAVSADGKRVVVVSNNTTFDTGPALQVIADDLKLLDDVMCAP
jgi:D-alanyl-D-alanine carboxypeptidase